MVDVCFQLRHFYMFAWEVFVGFSAWLSQSGHFWVIHLPYVCIYKPILTCSVLIGWLRSCMLVFMYNCIIIAFGYYSVAKPRVFIWDSCSHMQIYMHFTVQCIRLTGLSIWHTYCFFVHMSLNFRLSAQPDVTCYTSPCISIWRCMILVFLVLLAWYLLGSYRDTDLSPFLQCTLLKRGGGGHNSPINVLYLHWEDIVAMYKAMVHSFIYHSYVFQYSTSRYWNDIYSYQFLV